MKKWQSAVNNFLEKWKKHPQVTGALVTGSRVFGLANMNSDVDVHILLKPGTKWRERGNRLVDGFLIEYFANSPGQHRQYIKEDFADYSRTNARMLAYGTIIFDKTGQLRKLQKLCRRELKRDFPRQSRTAIETAKYAIWDELDNLQALWHQHSPLYDFGHKNLLETILASYRRYHRVEFGASSRFYSFFTDSEYRRKYRLRKFRDPAFVRLFLSALKDSRFPKIEELVRHTLKRMGGFKIDGWTLRSRSAL